MHTFIQRYWYYIVTWDPHECETCRLGYGQPNSKISFKVFGDHLLYEGQEDKRGQEAGKLKEGGLQPFTVIFNLVPKICQVQGSKSTGAGELI